MSGERVRLFVALDLPGPVREALVQWRSSRDVGEPRALRPVAPNALHVTLCFLGWRSASEFESIAAACAAVASMPAPALTLGAARWLPVRRPRVLAVEVEDDSGWLAQVQAALSGALQAGAWYVPEARPFLAHVTVCRVRRGARIRASELPRPPAVAFGGSTVTLYRSRLGAGGAQYEALRRVSLSGSRN